MDTPKKIDTNEKKLAVKLSAKKLPKNLKKSYTKKDLEKKILKKLYIEADKKFIQSQYTEDLNYSQKIKEKADVLAAKGKTPKPQNIRYCIPQTNEYEKKDFIRLKILGKQIATQKGRIRFVPLAACIGFIAALILIVIIAKNPLAKAGLIWSIQKITGARAEVQLVDIGILDSRITIKKLAAANKGSPMKNLFEAEKIELDFNLVQLLRGRFVSENIEVSGMAFGTDRKTSGELPLKAKVTQKKEESAFTKNLKKESGDAILRAKASITGLFDQLNPQTILENTLKQLKSPELAKEGQAELEKIIPRWESRPAQIETSLKNFEASSKKVLERDYQSMRDLLQIRAAIEDIETTIKEGKSLSETLSSTVKDLKTDSEHIKVFAKKAGDALKQDHNLLSKEIKKITSFNLDTGKKMISDSLSAIIYDTLGKYSSYVDQALAMAQKAKSSGGAKQKPAPKPKKGRMAGRNIEYTKDVYPTFLIQRVFASGTGFDGSITDISNNPDKWGKPAALRGKLDESIISGQKRLHKGILVFDGRTYTKDPLLFAEYSGSGYRVNINASDLGADTIGIPSLSGTTGITGSFSAALDGSFSLAGSLNLNPIKLSTAAFEPEFAYRIYSNCLKGIQDMILSVKTGYSPANGVILNITSNVDKKFIQALQSSLNEELEQIKKQAEKIVKAELEKYSGPFTEQLAKFTGIEGGILGSQTKLTSIEGLLNGKRTELLKRLEDSGKSVVEEKAGDLLKGLFKH